MESSSFERGEAMRRKVLGDAHVDRALNSPDLFLKPVQEITTGFAWGDVWTRTDLPLATRSLITLAMLIPLNRPHELKTHTRGALNNGRSVAEIRAVFGGAPRALMAHANPCDFPYAFQHL